MLRSTFGSDPQSTPRTSSTWTADGSFKRDRVNATRSARISNPIGIRPNVATWGPPGWPGTFDLRWLTYSSSNARSSSTGTDHETGSLRTTAWCSDHREALDVPFEGRHTAAASQGGC